MSTENQDYDALRGWRKPTIEPRTAIKGGEWRVTIQLEIDGERAGAPLNLRYVDTAVTYSGKGKKLGMPEDFGYLISLALDQHARAFKKPRAKRAK